MSDPVTVSHALPKAGSALMVSAVSGAAVAGADPSVGYSVQEIAAIVASVLSAIYTLALFSEWLWKKVLRPFAESRGWVKRRQRRKNDAGD